MKEDGGPRVSTSTHGSTQRRFSMRLVPRLLLTLLAIVIFTPLLAFPMIIVGLFPKGGGATFRMAVWWCSVVYRAMGLSFSVEGRERVVPGASYIVTPNHQGNADILALITVLPVRFRWVIKKELLRIPLFGWALGKTGAISLDRSDPTKAVRALKGASSKLKDGWSVLIYPEGTRSKNPHLQPFKKGPFMLAVQTGIPILPVVCNGAFHVLPRKTCVFIPGHIKVTIGNSIATEGLGVEDVPELMERTRQEMLKYLEPDYNPFEGKWSRLGYPSAHMSAGCSGNASD